MDRTFEDAFLDELLGQRPVLQGRVELVLQQALLQLLLLSLPMPSDHVR